MPRLVMLNAEETDMIMTSVNVTRDNVTLVTTYSLQSTESDIAILADQWLRAKHCTAPQNI
jgi:hypothetical protein